MLVRQGLSVWYYVVFNIELAKCISLIGYILVWSTMTNKIYSNLSRYILSSIVNCHFLIKLLILCQLSNLLCYYLYLPIIPDTVQKR